MIRYNINSLQPIQTQINKKAEIHPDLIYFHIKFINLKFDKKIDRKIVADFFQYQMTIEYQCVELRNKWIQNQINAIEKSWPDELTKNKAVKSLKEKLVPPMLKPKSIDPPVLIDKNMVDYFSFSFLTETEIEDYDPNVIYAKLKEKLYKDKINYFVDKYKNIISQKENVSLDLIPEIIDYLYIFYMYEDYVKSQSDFQVYEYILKILELYYAPLNRSWFSLGGGFSTSNNFDNYSQNISYKNWNDRTLEFPVGLHFWSYQPTITGHIKVNFLKKHLTFFSYIKLYVSYSQNLNKHFITFSGDHVIDYYIRGNEYTETLKFENPKITIQNLEIKTVGFSIPLITLFNKLVFEGAFNISNKTIEYEVDYKYYYSLVFKRTNLLLIEHTGEERFKNREKFDATYPSLNIVYIFQHGIVFSTQLYSEQVYFNIAYNF